MKKLKFALLLFVVLLIGGVIWWINGLGAVNITNKSPKSFVVAPGSGLKAVAFKLKEANLIRDPFVFFILVKTSGLDGKIQAGDFQLSPSQSAWSIAQTLTHGTADIWVTVPEGKRSEEIAAILQKSLPNYSPDWLSALKQHEGYLFPDTYLFPKDATIDTVISTMTNNFEQKYAVAKAQATTSITKQDAVILASILEREGKSGNDMRTIASVLENRDAIGMALQVDATIQYALGYQPAEHSWWKKDLTIYDLKINSPYNTYTTPGLPPTPISNPGLESLKAVLNPAHTNYLYYISDKSGDIHFAATLDQHNANIRKYGL